MTLDQLCLTKTLGKGTYGTVHQAHIKDKPEIAYAVKIVSLDKKLKDNVIQEARYHCRLNHLNICAFHGAFYDDDKLCMMLDYHRLGTLRDRIKNVPSRKLPPAEAATYMVQIANGLDYIHQQGLIHRDIKEANILMLEDQTIKISDFGVAVPISKTGWNTSYGGTRGWMSPEMIQSKPYNHTTDVWLAGVVFFRLLTGERPFSEPDGSTNTANIIKAVYPVPSFLDKNACGLIAQMLAKKPRDRIDLSKVRFHSWICENMLRF